MQSSSDLFSYPNDWSEQALEAVAEINPESLGSSTPSSFQFQYIDISSVNVGVIDWHSVITQVFATAPSRARRIVRPGDVLLSTVRPGLQSHAFADWGDSSDSYICSTGFAVIRAGRALEPRFLRHLVFSNIVATQLNRLETGSNYPAVPESDVKLLHIPVPPLPEQRRIAEILDAADEAIRQTERLIAKLKAVKAGLLQDLLTHGLDEHGHLRDPQAHPEQFKDSPMGRIPGEWQVRRLGEFGEFKNGLNKGKEDFGFGTKFVNISDVYLPRLDTDNLGRMNATSSEVESYRLEVGDILFDRSSVKLEGVGYPTVFEGADEPVIFCGFIIRFRMLESIARPIFLCEQMRDELFRNRMFQIATRSANVNVNQEQLSKLQVVLPPVQEQETIITILDIHNARIRAEEAELAKLRKVKRGLMDDLLTGKVRVKL